MTNKNPNFYNKISSFNKNDTLELFFIFKDKTIKKAKLENNTSEKMLENFLKILLDYFDDNTEYRDISTYDDTTKENEYLFFNNQGIYEKIEHLTLGWDNTDSIEPTDKLEENIFGCIFKISSINDYIILYQQCYPMSFITKQKFISLFIEGASFKEINKDIFNISYRIDFLIDKDFFVILNIKPLENQYQYKEVIQKEAQKVIGIVSTLNFIENLNLLTENMSPTYAKKIKNTDEKVLDILRTDLDLVKKFIQKHPELNQYLNFNNENKLELKNKQSVKYLIKLLSNDYLHSLLTKDNFDSNSKRKIT